MFWPVKPSWSFTCGPSLRLGPAPAGSAGTVSVRAPGALSIFYTKGPLLLPNYSGKSARLRSQQKIWDCVNNISRRHRQHFLYAPPSIRGAFVVFLTQRSSTCFTHRKFEIATGQHWGVIYARRFYWSFWCVYLTNYLIDIVSVILLHRLCSRWNVIIAACLGVLAPLSVSPRGYDARLWIPAAALPQFAEFSRPRTPAGIWEKNSLLLSNGFT